MAAERGPVIIALLCSWCSYAGADRAGSERLPVPASLQVVRVPCSGAVEPHTVLSAFSSGADGVIILACHPGDCHFHSGNCRALKRFVMLSGLLKQLGIAPERFRFDHVSAAEGGRFAEIVGKMAEELEPD